jgi:hypothetical protein
MWKLRVRIDDNILLRVPIRPEATVADLAAEIVRRLTKPGGAREGIDTQITALKDEDGCELDTDDLIGQIVQTNAAIIAELRRGAAASQPGKPVQAMAEPRVSSEQQAAKSEGRDNCKSDLRASEADAARNKEMQQLRQVVHGSGDSAPTRAEMVAVLIGPTEGLPPSHLNQMRQIMAGMTHDQLRMQHGMRVTAARLTPEVETRGGVAYLSAYEATRHMSDTEYEAARVEHKRSLDKRTAIYNEGLEECSKAGAKWLKSTLACNLKEMRKMLGGDFGGATIRGVPLFEAIGSATKWLLNYQDGSGQTAVIVALRAMDPHCTLPVHLQHERGGAGALAVLQFLTIQMGADVNIRMSGPPGMSVKSSALHMAAMVGLVDAVRLLLEAGAEVDIREEDECTALHLAAQESQAEIIECLLEAGADVNLLQKHGGTALMMAAQKGCLAAVSALITAGAAVDVREQAQGGASALSFAANKGHAAVVSRLLQAGADVNLEADAGEGTSPLHKALLCDQHDLMLETLRVLLRAGADMHRENNAGFSAMKMASNLASFNPGGRGTLALNLMQQAELDRRLLEEGAAVKVEGLVGAPELNGRAGVVASFDSRKQRYVVALAAEAGEDPPKSIALKPENLCAKHHLPQPAAQAVGAMGDALEARLLAEIAASGMYVADAAGYASDLAIVRDRGDSVAEWHRQVFPAPRVAPEAAPVKIAAAPEPEAVLSDGISCSVCKLSCPRHQFSKTQQKKAAGQRKCKQCVSGVPVPGGTGSSGPGDPSTGGPAARKATAAAAPATAAGLRATAATAPVVGPVGLLALLDSCGELQQLVLAQLSTRELWRCRRISTAFDPWVRGCLAANLPQAARNQVSGCRHGCPKGFDDCVGMHTFVPGPRAGSFGPIDAAAYNARGARRTRALVDAGVLAYEEWVWTTPSPYPAGLTLSVKEPQLADYNGLYKLQLPSRGNEWRITGKRGKGENVPQPHISHAPHYVNRHGRHIYRVVAHLPASESETGRAVTIWQWTCNAHFYPEDAGLQVMIVTKYCGHGVRARLQNRIPTPDEEHSLYCACRNPPASVPPPMPFLPLQPLKWDVDVRGGWQDMGVVTKLLHTPAEVVQEAALEEQREATTFGPQASLVMGESHILVGHSTL